MNIIKYPLPITQYYQQEHKKTQIVLHHTASSSNAKNVINGWASDTRRVATPYVISHNGDIYEAFDPKYWAAAIGYFITGLGGNDEAYKLLPETANREHNLAIELRTINIELTNWGYLTEKNGKFYSYVNTEVPKENVITLDKPFRGFTHYEKYPKQQIDATIELVKDLGHKFNIPLKFSQSFDFSKEVVLGTPGITTHVNYRFDKIDLFPDPNIVEALKQFS